jgi:amino acid transporter
VANLAQIAGKYTFLLFGAEGVAESVFWVTLAGVLFIAVLTWVCYVGIEASARTQYFLLGAEIVTLVIFAAVALGKVWVGDAASRPPSWWRSSSTGAGTAPSPSTRRPRTPTARRASPRSSPRSSWSAST